MIEMSSKAKAAWQRVSRAHPCRVCGKPDWCLISTDSRSVICARVESARRCGEAGWLHVESGQWIGECQRPVVFEFEAAATTHGWDAAVSGFESNLASNRLRELSAHLGVSAESLRRLRVGWSNHNRAFTFPMVNADGRIVGVRLRTPSGRKLAIRGGKQGLFVPVGPSARRLVICEGPTDTAAVLDLELNAIGRPSCSGGAKQIVGLVVRSKPDRIVLIADSDLSGCQGAQQLGATLVAYANEVRIVYPPNGVKDAREWVRQGATHEDLLRAIDSTVPLRLHISARRVGHE